VWRNGSAAVSKTVSGSSILSTGAKTFYLQEQIMLKYLRVGLPFFVIVACVINFITAFNTDNSLAMMGYITAFFGWTAIAWDEYLTYQRNKRIENVSDSVA
jgi:hypothetical protein